MTAGPILQITDGRGRLRPLAGLKVLALTRWPNDIDRQANFFATSFANAWVIKASSNSRLPLAKEILSCLLKQIDEATRDQERNSDRGAYDAFVTGELLLGVLRLATWSPRDASLSKAAELWSREHLRLKDGRGRRIATSQSALLGAFSRFRSVAHFCAAWRLVAPDFEFGEHLRKRSLLRYLAVAEGLRRFGENHHSPMGRTNTVPSAKPLLDPVITWKLPADLRLPVARIGVSKPTPAAKASLAEYRSGH